MDKPEKPQKTNRRAHLFRTVLLIIIPLALVLAGMWLFVWRGPTALDFARIGDKIAVIDDTAGTLNTKISSQKTAGEPTADEIAQQKTAFEAYVAANDALLNSPGLDDGAVKPSYQAYSDTYNSYKKQFLLYLEQSGSMRDFNQRCTATLSQKSGELLRGDETKLVETFETNFKPCYDVLALLAKSSNAATKSLAETYSKNLNAIKDALGVAQKAYADKSQAKLDESTAAINGAAGEFSKAIKAYNQTFSDTGNKKLAEDLSEFYKAVKQKIANS